MAGELLNLAVDFNLISHVAGWVGVGSLVCCAYLLLSFLVLPAQRTSRHYLTICLVAAIFFLQLAFVVPLGTKPNQCYDAITPNDLHSDISCALSGIFLLGGGFGGVVWVFIRSLSVHLQIYWKIVPGTMFFYVSQLLGWGVTALILGLSLSMSGVSYRLGTTCHINHANSIGTFWGPVLALAALSLMIQLITFAYCIKVYLQVANGPGGLPSTAGSTTTYNTSVSGSNRSTVVKKATYRRVRKVIALQWRGMTVVFIVIVSACYLATIFLMLDSDVSNVSKNLHLILPWVECIAKNRDGNQACADLASPFILPDRVVLPVLYLIAIIGFWALFFLGKWDMVVAWKDLFLSPFRRGRTPSRSSSPSLRAQSQQSFSTRLRGGPQHLHLIKDERGLSVANKMENTYAIELMRSPSFVTKSLSHDPTSDHFSNRDLESAYSDLHSQSHGTSSGAGTGLGDAPSAEHPQHVIRPTQSAYFDKVWAPPRSPSRSQARGGGGGSFNFSRPSTVQPASASSVQFASPLTYDPSSPPPKTSNSTRHLLNDDEPTLPAAVYHHEPSRSDSTFSIPAAASGWFMSPQAPEEEEDTVPLSPTLPPVIPARAPGRLQRQQSKQSQHRPRADSRASSLYSFGNIGSYTGRESRVHSPAFDRPSQGMAWDPSSTFASPFASPSSTPTPGAMPSHRQNGQSTPRSESPALGRHQQR